MAVNQHRRAEKLAKARSKAKERKKKREWQSQWAPNYHDPEALGAIHGLVESDPTTNPYQQYGLRKMSEVLLELIEPLNPADAGPDGLLNMAKAAMIAWSMALLPEEKLRHVFDDTPMEVPPEIKVVVLMLIQRKLDLFPDDDRVIADVFVRTDEKGEAKLMAVSTLKLPAGR